MDTTAIISFLKELKENNNREWFAENKSRYDKVRAEFIGFLDALIPEISKFDPSVAHLEGKKCAFRIYRDVRFSHDKSPYKTQFGAMIMSGASKTEIHNKAGYYVHIESGESFIGGGAYMPPSDWLKAIRKEIAYNADDFRKIIDSRDFKKYFGEVEGESLSRPPQGFDPDHPEIELLKKKSYLAMHPFSDKELKANANVKYFAEVFKTMYPFNKFLNEAGGE